MAFPTYGDSTAHVYTFRYRAIAFRTPLDFAVVQVARDKNLIYAAATLRRTSINDVLRSDACGTKATSCRYASPILRTPSPLEKASRCSAPYI